MSDMEQMWMAAEERRLAAFNAHTGAIEAQAAAAREVAESVRATVPAKQPPYVYHRQAGGEQPVPPDQDHPWELWGINEGKGFLAYYWRRPADQPDAT